MRMVSPYLKIGQISDTHIRGKSVTAQDIMASRNFAEVIKDVKKEDLDLLVISGDLAENKSEEDYSAFFEMLKDVNKPLCFISGNHDDNLIIKKCSPFEINLIDGMLFYKKIVKGITLFFLDSSSGIISKNQLDWIREEAFKEQNEVILFVHHPPCLCGHKFMDAKYALKNIDETIEVLHKIKNLKSIFVGHYHSDMVVDIGCGQTVYVTPSTQMQLDYSSPEFKISSSRPAWRIIEYNEGKLFTKVRFL